jgi:hypothetical protein
LIDQGPASYSSLIAEKFLCLLAGAFHLFLEFFDCRLHVRTGSEWRPENVGWSVFRQSVIGADIQDDLYTLAFPGFE